VTGLRASVVCVECLGASRDPLFVHEAPHPARVRRIHDGQRPRHEITSKCTAPGFLDTEQDVIVIDSALASFSHRGETAIWGNTQIAAPSQSRVCEPLRPSGFDARPVSIVRLPSPGPRPAPATVSDGRGARSATRRCSAR